MTPSAKAAELDKAAAVLARLGLRPCAWSDGDIHVEEVYSEPPLFVVYPLNIAAGGETRCSAADLDAVVARARSAVAKGRA